jgi:hypothetical protein
MFERTGTLRPAVETYLFGRPLTPEHIAALRACLCQWIAAPVWQGAKIDLLRDTINNLTSRAAIANWLAIVEEDGLDPL